MATRTPGDALAHPIAGSAAKRTPGRGHTRSAVLFLAPFGLLFTAMLLAPIGYAVYQSSSGRTAAASDWDRRRLSSPGSTTT